MRLTFGLYIIGLMAVTPVTAAQPNTPQASAAPPGAIPLAEAPGKPYDLVANCLMRQLKGQRYVAWPLVYAPPRQEALVNLWLRGHEYERPIAIFHVSQDSDGMTRISLERMAGESGPSQASAQAAARQCLR
jgi:hypothetical protein